VPVDRHRCDLNLPMIARRSNVPVCILASKRDIKRVIAVHAGPSTREVSSIAAAGVHTVVTDELARGFEHFFEKVYVVEDEAQFPRARSRHLDSAIASRATRSTRRTRGCSTRSIRRSTASSGVT